MIRPFSFKSTRRETTVSIEGIKPHVVTIIGIEFENVRWVTPLPSLSGLTSQTHRFVRRPRCKRRLSSRSVIHRMRARPACGGNYSLSTSSLLFLGTSSKPTVFKRLPLCHRITFASVATQAKYVFFSLHTLIASDRRSCSRASQTYSPRSWFVIFGPERHRC